MDESPLSLTLVANREHLYRLLPTDRMDEGVPAVIRGRVYHLHLSWWDWEEGDTEGNISISYPGSDQDGLFDDSAFPIWVIEVRNG